MWNPLAWAMEAAAIISIALLDVPDFVLIVGLLIINAVISYYEESNADKAIKVGCLDVACSLTRVSSLLRGLSGVLSIYVIENKLLPWALGRSVASSIQAHAATTPWLPRH